MAKSKIGLIIGHEYLIRVRKKSFWLVGILTPLAIVAVGVLIGFLSVANNSEEIQVAVYDSSSRLSQRIESDDNISFIPFPGNSEQKYPFPRLFPPQTEWDFPRPNRGPPGPFLPG